MEPQTIFGKRVELVLYDSQGRRLHIRKPLDMSPASESARLRIEHISSCIQQAEQSGQWGDGRRRPLLDGGDWQIELPG